MKLGLISDIHADHEALQRALALLEKRGAEKVVCMGDIVEKGKDGAKVVQALYQNMVTCVRGNHDDNAIRRFNDQDHDDQDPLLDPFTISLLELLPTERTYHWDSTRIVISHIAPAGYTMAPTSDQIPKQLKRILRNYEADLLLLGHTHQPMKLAFGDMVMINPGSVSGTRERDSYTCGLLELPSMQLQIFSIESGAEIPFVQRSSAACQADGENPHKTEESLRRSPKGF